MPMLETIRAFIELHQASLGLLILTVMFFGFISERFPATVVAILGACTFLFLGILDADTLFSVFSNPAPITIGALFVITGALLRTGTIDALADMIIKRAKARPRLALAEMFFGSFFASAFMNNTPVVLVLIPIMKKLAKEINVSVKRLLIPLSFIAIMGGTTTLIGTSTNLLVDAVAQDEGMVAFGIFEITKYGVLAALAGALTLILVGRFVLPSGDADEMFGESDDTRFLTGMLVIEGSDVIGRSMSEINLFKRGSINAVALRRGSNITRTGIADQPLEVGDRIVVKTDLAELVSLRANNKQFEIGIIGPRGVPENDDSLVEATIAPFHPAIGQPLESVPFLSQLPVRILGLTRYRNLPGPYLARAKLRAADRILISGTTESIRALHDNPNLMGIGVTKARAFRRDRAPIAVGGLIAVVLLAAFGIVPISVAAILAVGGILLARCIDAEEAWGSIDGNVLVLIFAMLAVGLALQQAGSVQLVVDQLTPILSQFPPWAVIFTVYLMSLLLTEIVTNNAVAILITPIVITLGHDIGMDPRPLVITVMLAASASFVTPIGYQTNTLVYAAGNYKFSDFIRAGLPVSLAVGITNCIAIAFIF